MPEEAAPRQSEEPGQPGQSQPAARAAGPTGLRARIRPALTRYRWPGLLAAGGIALVAVAFAVVYPTPETQIAVPASPSLVIYTDGHVGQVRYVVTSDGTGLPEVQVTVSLLGSGLLGNQVVPLPVPPQGTSSVELTLPPGLMFRNCGTCISDAGEVAWVQPLDFQKLKATDMFPVGPAGFGVDVGSPYAYAAIPEVSFMSLTTKLPTEAGVTVLPPALRAEYPIPAAGSYDWSSGPVPTVTGSVAVWQEILAGSDTPAQTAAGVDHRRQVHDADFTFWAGLLIGLAGSVVLAGLQLLLPPAPGSDADRKNATAG